MITDKFINEISKMLNGESYVIPAYLAVATTSVSAINAADTSLSGEVGSRIALSKSRSGNVVSYSGIRSGVSVINPVTGDILNSSGTFSSSSGANLMTGIVHAGITHTTAYDIEFVIQIEPQRK